MIVHICSRTDWEAALKCGSYQADSLAASGFIHCSLPSQAPDVANRIFSGRKNMLLLWIDPDKLKAEVRWEASDSEIFPHVYGPIELEAVTAILDFPPDNDGVFRSIPGNLRD